MAKQMERVIGRVAVIATVLGVLAIVAANIPGAQDWAQKLSDFGQSHGRTADIAEAEQALAKGDKQRALDIAAKIVSEQGSDAAVDNRAGNVAAGAGDSAAAERYYEMGESADVKNPWNYASLAALYLQQGKYGQADPQYRAALNIAPKAPFLHYDLGIIELREHLYAAALADFKAEIARSPSYKPARDGEKQALAAMGPLPSQAPRGGPSPTVSPSPSPSPSPLPIAAVVLPSPTPSSAATIAPTPAPTTAPTIPTARPHVRRHKPLVRPRPIVLTAAATIAALPPARTPEPMTDLAADARTYFLGVTTDLGFTRALTQGDPSAPTSTLMTQMNIARKTAGADIGGLLVVGTSALVSGRLSLAHTAFGYASEKAPFDWRGPYFDGLTSQARGDSEAALALFRNSVARGAGPEAYVSLAIADVDQGDDGDALNAARRAATMAPGYEPARFTEGMVALISADAPTAVRELGAAVSLGGAPERTQFFLNALRKREEGTPPSP